MHETYDSEIQKLATPRNFPVRLGIIGGGQLARMTAIAALPLGCEVIVLENNPLSPAARLSPDSIVGDWNDPETLRQFAARCDVITLENEFVDARALQVLEKVVHKVFPAPPASLSRKTNWLRNKRCKTRGWPCQNSAQ
jgi:5-(carboxyamino)imidazole ribonucleotide synthase